MKKTYTSHTELMEDIEETATATLAKMLITSGAVVVKVPAIPDGIYRRVEGMDMLHRVGGKWYAIGLFGSTGNVNSVLQYKQGKANKFVRVMDSKMNPDYLGKIIDLDMNGELVV